MKNELPKIIATGYFNAEFQFKGKEISSYRLVEMYELDLPLENGGSYFIDGNEYQIRRGVLFISRAGQRRKTKLPFKCLYVHLTVENEEISEFLNSLPNQLILSNFDEYERAFSQLIESYTFIHEKHTFLIQRNLFNLFCLLSDSYAFLRKGNTPLSKAIKDALTYIEENFHKDISLDEISNSVHLSKIYFHNFFKKEIGETPHSYIQKKRIEKAKQLLASSDSSFSEIAELCGFNSQSYLNYIFKKQTGKTLSEYKKHLISKYSPKL